MSPQKWELVINLRAAKALQLAIQPWLIARANEVIEQGITLAASHVSAARLVISRRSLRLDNPAFPNPKRGAKNSRIIGSSPADATPIFISAQEAFHSLESDYSALRRQCRAKT